MAEDFDESAALPVGEVIAQLRESLGIPADGTTPDDKDDQGAAAGGEDDQAGDPDPDKKTGDDDDADDDDADDADGTPSDKDKNLGPAAKKLREKYDFDDEKQAEGWLALQNSIAKVVQRLDAMEERANKQAGSTESHPDIVALQEEVEDLQEDLKENQAEQRALVKKGEGVRAEMAKLQGKLEITEDEAKRDALQARIDTLQERLNNHGDKWQSIEKENKKLVRKAQQIESKRKQVEEDIKESQEATRTQAQKVKAWQDDQNLRFHTAVKELGKIYNMTPGQHKLIGRIIKDEIREYLTTHPDGDPINVVAFVASRAKAHTAELGIKSRFAKKGEEKKEVARVGNGQRGPTKEPTVPPKRQTGSQEKAAADATAARLHARKVLGNL